MAAATAAASARMSAAPSRTAGPSTLQLLSFVFASADMVVEIGEDGAVTFATGAAGRLLGREAEQLAGVAWRELVDAGDSELVEAALADLRPGERRGPFRIRLAGQGAAQVTLFLFQVPQQPGRTACAFSLCQPSFAEVKVDATGMASREDFEAAATALLEEADRAGVPLHVDLLEFAGLVAALEIMPTPEAEAARRKLAAILRAASYGGLPATALAEDRFAVLRSGDADAAALTERVQAVAGPAVTVSSSELVLDPASPAESLRAVRYALDRCIEEGPDAASKSFEAALRQTVTESRRFKDVLLSGRFELVFQPVVDLKTRALHHYEALARFEGGGGPAATIRLAEELGLIVEFDLAIVRGVATALREAPAEVSIAANVSGFSLQQPGFVDQVLETTRPMPRFRPRLLIEITESHRIIDLEAANEAIQGLRDGGHIVCLDDFGAGSASLDYLRRLETDVVKFDGRFVQALHERPRDCTILRRTAELCRELGVETVAEMIETEETARLVAELGIGLGQGWLFGKPVAKPVRIEPPRPIVARRSGTVETWY